MASIGIQRACLYYFSDIKEECLKTPSPPRSVHLRASSPETVRLLSHLLSGLLHTKSTRVAMVLSVGQPYWLKN